MVQWLGLRASTAGGPGFDPWSGSKVVWSQRGQKNPKTLFVKKKKKKKFYGVQHNDLLYVHHEMISTISLVNVHHLIQTQKETRFFPCDENS